MELQSLVKYKIHGINSVGGVTRSSNNNIFYDSYKQAHEQCMEYMRRPGSVGFVIMKTCAIIRAATPPLEVHVVQGSGRIVPLQNTLADE